MIGPAFTGSVTFPSAVVVALLKPERFCPTEFSMQKESFICMKAGSYSKSGALPESTSTLCTSKPLIQRVSTKASWWGTMTLFGLIEGNDMEPSIGSASP